MPRVMVARYALLIFIKVTGPTFCYRYADTNQNSSGGDR